MQLQHTLRTPLTSLLALSDLAIDHWKEWSDPERVETLDDIHTAAEQILQLSDRLSDPACLPGGVVDIQPQTVTWRSMCDVVRASRPPGERCPWTVSGDVDSHFRCDRARFVQLLRELLDNACRYAGGAELRVSVSAEAVELVVADTGPGIPSPVQERLGQPFVWGAPPEGSAFHGLGLGLMAARRIAEAHGGSLRIESGPAGTTATVRVPKA